jgi:hypothetical protein
LAVVVVALAGCLTARVSAQAPSAPDQAAAAQAVRAEVERLRQEFDAVRQQYGDRLAALEARLAAIESGKGAAPAPASPPNPTASGGSVQGGTRQGVEVPAGAAGAGGPQGSLPVYGNPSALSKIFNPDIAVIGNFLGATGHNEVAPPPTFEMSEAEASFQAIVDPYARADFFVGVGGDGSIDLEEGFLTLTSLPGGLLAKVGKMYSAFGRVNQMHSHVLPWTDRPLMNVNLLGGDENITDAGFSVSRLIPNPWVFLEATGEVFRGESAVFRAPSRSDLSYVGRVRGYHDATESSNIDLGTSFAYGHNDAVEANGTTRLIGIDATFRYRPLRRANDRRFTLRTELTWSRRSEIASLGQSFGTYVSAEYQLARRWFGGVRFDYADRATDPNLGDKGGSLLLTFWPSEFSQIRAQYRRTKYADSASTANEFLFQFLFSIGAHGAHAF